MNTKVYKYCGVPMCKNTTIKTPEKLFIHVPKNKQIRRKWFSLAKRDLKSITNCYYCEDHFDLPNDMENYVEYTTMGVVSQIRMRSGCLPSKFACHNNTSDISRPNTGKKRKLASKVDRKPYIDPSRSSDFIKQELNDTTQISNDNFITSCRSERTPGSHPEMHSSAGEQEQRLHEEISLPYSPVYIKQEREDTPKADEFLSQLQQEMEELKRENQRLVEENRTLKEKKESGENNDSKLPTADVLHKLKSDNELLVTENSRLTNEIENINRKNEKHVQKLTEKNQCCLTKIQKLEAKIQELDRRIEELVDGDKLAEKNQDLYEKIQYLNQKVEHLNKETAELNQKKAELSEKVRGLYTQNRSLEKKVQSFEDKVSGLVGENQALATELKALTQLHRFYRESKRKMKVPKEDTSTHPDKP